MTLPYVILREPDGWYACLPHGESIGPYPTREECVRDMANIERHLAAGSFGGAK